MTRLPRLPLLLTATAIAAATLTGCSGDSKGSSTPTGNGRPRAAASSPGGPADVIGHQTQFVQPTKKSHPKSLLPKIRRLHGVILAAYEPDDKQFRVFLSPHVTYARRLHVQEVVRKIAT